MSGHIRHCTEDRTYTISTICPVCGKPTAIAHPARFSIEDRYGKYRRQVKKND